MTKIPIIFFSKEEWGKNSEGVIKLMRENLKRYEEAKKEIEIENQAKA